MQRIQGKDLPRLRMLVVALAAAGAVLAQQAQADVPYTKGGVQPTYRVINLSPGLLASIPDINAKGQVSFSVQAGSGATGYFYNGSVLRNIGTFGGDSAIAVDLNEKGQVTGTSTTASGAERAFIYSEGAGLVDIGTPTGLGQAQGAAINNSGVITGNAFDFFAVLAFRWSAGTGAENLGAFTSGIGAASYGTAINDAGLIAGMSDTADNNRHAFIWTRTGGLVDIDTLHSVDSMPVAVGARGEVAGNRLPTNTSPRYRPFLWTAATGMVDLGVDGGIGAFVLRMTPDVQMAGAIAFADDSQRAMYWTRATGLRNLGTLGGTSSRAYGVNTKGQVVGYADNKANDSHAFIWSANRGMLDLNKYLRNAPPGLVLDDALAINDGGAIVATSNAGLVLLRPEGTGAGAGAGVGSLVLGPIAAPDLVKAGAPLQAAVGFVDEAQAGTRSVSWSWGDGSADQAGTVRASGSAADASASHSFATPGIYTVTATVVDRAGRSTAVSHDVVVTAAAGGAVAGAGTVSSPAAAPGRTLLHAGKAQFRLLAPSGAGAGAIPGRLHFDLPGWQFRSQDLRLTQATAAQHVFEGSGAVRGKGGYQFRLATAATASGNPGRFALKIWHTDPVNKAVVVDFDNTRTADGVASGADAGRVTKGTIVLE